METYNEVLRAALALPFDQRWKLVEELDETLHPPPKYKTQDEFEAMVHQRIEDIEAGRAKGCSPEEGPGTSRSAGAKTRQAPVRVI